MCGIIEYSNDTYAKGNKYDDATYKRRNIERKHVPIFSSSSFCCSQHLSHQPVTTSLDLADLCNDRTANLSLRALRSSLALTLRLLLIVFFFRGTLGLSGEEAVEPTLLLSVGPLGEFFGSFPHTILATRDKHQSY